MSGETVSSPSPVRVPSKDWVLAWVGSLTFLLDQWTKRLIHTHYHFRESHEILSPVFSLTYVRNMGAAFGLLNNLPAWIREPFFVCVPIVALVAIAVYFVK